MECFIKQSVTNVIYPAGISDRGRHLAAEGRTEEGNWLLFPLHRVDL